MGQNNVIDSQGVCEEDRRIYQLKLKCKCILIEHTKVHLTFKIRVTKESLSVNLLNPTYYGPFKATSDIGRGTMCPAIVMHVPFVIS